MQYYLRDLERQFPRCCSKATPSHHLERNLRCPPSASRVFFQFHLDRLLLRRAHHRRSSLSRLAVWLTALRQLSCAIRPTPSEVRSVHLYSLDKLQLCGPEELPPRIANISSMSRKLKAKRMYNQTRSE